MSETDHSGRMVYRALLRAGEMAAIGTGMSQADAEAYGRELANSPRARAVMASVFHRRRPLPEQAPPGSSREAYVLSLYTSLVGRDPDNLEAQDLREAFAEYDGLACMMDDALRIAERDKP